MERTIDIYLGGDQLITALGRGTQENFRALGSKMCGLRPTSEPVQMVAGHIDAELLRSSLIEGYTPLESLMISCVADVAAQSAIDPASERCAIVISTTKGNVELLRHCATPPDGAYLYRLAERIATHFGATRQPLVISNACISGLSAMIVAQRMIREGECAHVIVVGGDLLTEFVAEGFMSFKSISPVPCRPYDNTPNPGLTLGEGCGAVVLTSDRSKAKLPLVVLEGGAITNDANHISGPSRTGDGLSFAIEGALAEAKVQREHISFVNAHGTGTAYNDAMESKALELSGLSDCPMNSLKGYIGHTLGASGVVEAILSAEELRRGWVFATAGFDQLGTPSPLNTSSEHRIIEMRHCIKTASGFGGCNAAIVMGLEPFVESEPRLANKRTYNLTAHYALPHTDEPFAEMIRREYRELERPNMKFFKMDDLSKGGYIAAERLLVGVDLSSYDPTEIALVVENRSSSLETDMAHQRIVNEHNPEGASPAVFVYTLPNVVLGEICIRHKIKGENTFFVTCGSGATAQRYAQRLVESGRARAVIYGRCEYFAGQYDIELTLIEQQ